MILLCRCTRVPALRPTVSSRFSSTFAKSFFIPNDISSKRAISIQHPASYRPAEVLTPKKLFNIYAQLSKSRLSVLVVLTAMSGVALSPLPTTVPVLLATAFGTGLCAAAANTLNQIQEIPFDAQMARTRMRPLVRRAITPFHAAGFALVTGIAGPAILWTMVNPLTALIGGGNILLYAGVYTWMKRRTLWNTWAGAVVGGLQPVMGWTACGGSLLPSSTYPIHYFLPSFLTTHADTVATVASSAVLDPNLYLSPLAPWTLALLLYSWQFPHFNGLSYLVRSSYAIGGYQMLSVLSPAQNALVGLRHALMMVPAYSVLVPLSGLTTWWFALTALAPNLFCVLVAWRFWKSVGGGSSRNPPNVAVLEKVEDQSGGEKHGKMVFQHSLWYLPLMMALMMVHKRGVDWWSWLGITTPEEEKPATEAAVVKA